MGIGNILLPFGANKMFQSFMHPEKGYQEAGKQMEQYYRDAQGNLQPIAQQGQAQYQRLMQQAEALNDPAALQAKWAQGYSQSPQATQAINQATDVGRNEASAQGLMGSSAALGNIQNTAGNIASNDRQKYMDDLMQKYMASIGLGQNMYGIGANASGQMSQNALGQGQNMAQARFGELNAPGALFGNILGKAADAGINYATGGVSGAVKKAA